MVLTKFSNMYVFTQDPSLGLLQDFQETLPLSSQNRQKTKLQLSAVCYI